MRVSFLRSGAAVFMVAALCVATGHGFARADTATAPATPLPGSLNGNTAFDNIPVRELCNNTNLTIAQLRFKKANEALINCDDYKVHGFGHVASYGMYGWTHPVTAFCNMGSGFKAALPGLVYGTTPGSKNIVLGVGAILTAFFAGCNNNPEPAPPSPAPTTGPALYVYPSTLSLPANTAGTVTVYEVNYGGRFFAATDDTNSIQIGTDSKSLAATATALADTPGQPITFSIKALKTVGKASFYVLDSSGAKDIITVDITAAPANASTPQPNASSTP